MAESLVNNARFVVVLQMMTPIPENQLVYDKLYSEYRLLYDYFGRGTNDVMKRLKAIRHDALS